MSGSGQVSDRVKYWIMYQFLRESEPYLELCNFVREYGAMEAIHMADEGYPSEKRAALIKKYFPSGKFMSGGLYWVYQDVTLPFRQWLEKVNLSMERPPAVSDFSNELREDIENFCCSGERTAKELGEYLHHCVCYPQCQFKNTAFSDPLRHKMTH